MDETRERLRRIIERAREQAPDPKPIQFPADPKPVPPSWVEPQEKADAE